MPELPNAFFCPECLRRRIKVPLLKCIEEQPACQSCGRLLVQLGEASVDSEGFLVRTYCCSAPNPKLCQGNGAPVALRISTDWKCHNCGFVHEAWPRARGNDLPTPAPTDPNQVLRMILPA